MEDHKSGQEMEIGREETGLAQECRKTATGDLAWRSDNL
jgi:hypothetical protein